MTILLGPPVLCEHVQARHLVVARAASSVVIVLSDIVSTDGILSRTRIASTASQPALYDLTTDLGETTNIAANHPKLVSRLQRALANWEQTVDQSALN